MNPPNKNNKNSTADLLLELGCEDLPAWTVRLLSQALAHGLISNLLKSSINCRYGTKHPVVVPRQVFVQAYEASEQGFIQYKDEARFDGLRIFATPRRIAVVIEDVAQRQKDQVVDRLGPSVTAAMKDGQPTQAGLGFAKSCGVEFSALGQKDGKLHFSRTVPGGITAELLPEMFEETLKGMDALVPKRMRWGSSDETFVRPVQWIVCMLGTKVIPLKRFGLTAGNKTYGHRFHAPKPIILKSPAEYEKKLKDAKVLAGFANRRDKIRQQVEDEAKELKGTARITDELLDEVTALVEWPVAIHGRMENRFMQLPQEVIIATIEKNQRYFPVFSQVTGGTTAIQQTRQRMLPYFITVSNIESKDVRQVIVGNERVVRPRLSDALFFWEQDHKKKLADFVSELDRVTFQKDLGSTGDKVRRVTKLAVQIAGMLNEDTTLVERAASLCKADLVTRMVFEFPELQGTVGGYYAEYSDETLEVAQAIREHYMPTHSGGGIPGSGAGQIVSLADKLDSLAGIFAIGQKPTASKDPFALRRAALGVLRICIEGKLSLDIKALLKSALDAQPMGKRNDATLSELWEFVVNRLLGLCSDRLFELQRPLDVAQAQNLASGKTTVSDWPIAEIVQSINVLGISQPLDFMQRAEAVFFFMKLPESGRLIAAHKRIRNILKQAGEGETEVRSDYLREPQENGLYGALKMLEGRAQAAAEKADYVGCLRLLAQLQQPVDAFFEKVMVMAPESELRANRVALLRQLDRLCRSVADISCLPG